VLRSQVEALVSNTAAVVHVPTPFNCYTKEVKEGRPNRAHIPALRKVRRIRMLGLVANTLLVSVALLRYCVPKEGKEGERPNIARARLAQVLRIASSTCSEQASGTCSSYPLPLYKRSK